MVLGTTAGARRDQQTYGTEAGVGQAIAESGIPRDQIYVTTKLANANHAPDDVRRSFEATLSDLGLEQLDLFLIHWPLRQSRCPRRHHAIRDRNRGA
jgi:diketogulonate reductase-like aldo/keto reductase